MKVAIDATSLALSSGGLKRYTQELSRALAEQFPEDRFFPVSARPQKLWWLVGVEAELARIGADLFHGANFVVPWLPLRPSVVTIHDLSLWLGPAWHGGFQFARWRTPLQAGLGLATMVITPSEAIRREVMDRFGLAPARVAAVPLAAAENFRPVPAAPRGRPYLLFVGTLEPRKNVGLLLRAWRQLRQNHSVDLVLAGRLREDFREPLAPEPGLEVLGEVAEEELPRLYSGAAACLYPSLYEGFGLPVLEAMQCGAVVIASRDPAVSETAGDAALLLDANDPRPWVEAMSAVLANPEKFAPLRARALERAKLFSWARTARLTREVYVEAMSRFGS
jgi:glycosyltransferase involved in cell wall biosynthesis